MHKICIDAGVLGFYLSKGRTKKVKDLMERVKNGDVEAHVIKQILIEVYFHLCKDFGATEAGIQLRNLVENFPFVLVELDLDLIASAGKLKCQHKDTLSYNDCVAIAHCLKNNVEFHTTEKVIKQIPHNTLERLRIVRYEWKV